MKRLLHWQIIIGMTSGILFALPDDQPRGATFVGDWIAPFGTIFIRLLKLIAIPLIFTSLVKGIADLKVMLSSFRHIGVRTILIYMGTTVAAITIGLLMVNTIRPGSGVSPETIEELTSTYAQDASLTSNIETATQQQQGPLSFLRRCSTISSATFGNNATMLQA